MKPEFKENMTSKDLVKVQKDFGLSPTEAVEQYKQWQVETGITKAPLVTPSEQLKLALGSEAPLDEAMLSIIAKALPMLDSKDTMKSGADMIIKVYDSIKGNKHSSISISNNMVSQQQRDDSLVALKKLADIEITK